MLIVELGLAPLMGTSDKIAGNGGEREKRNPARLIQHSTFNIKTQTRSALPPKHHLAKQKRWSGGYSKSRLLP